MAGRQRFYLFLPLLVRSCPRLHTWGMQIPWEGSLEVLTGPLRGRILGPEPRMTLGGAEADLDLEDPFVSARHLEIRAVEGGYLLRDLGSRNGTWLDGIPLGQEEALLRPGSLLRLGATSLRLREAGLRPEGFQPATGGRAQTLDLSSGKDVAIGPRPPWLAALGRVLVSPASGEELAPALLEAVVQEGPFARIAFGTGEPPDRDSGTHREGLDLFAARSAEDEGLLLAPMDLAKERAEAALVVDLALDPTEAGAPSHLFCSAAFTALHRPGGEERAWIYGDTLGEASTLDRSHLEQLVDLGRFLLGLLVRLQPGREVLRQEQARFLGDSQAVRSLLLQARKLADAEIPILLHGETGTGKEVLAHVLHDGGRRAQGAFVPVNCAALPEGLAESLLFGHRRGAFTGAEQDERGLIREAHGGTLFLDEIAELSPLLQAKLLRVLQEGEVMGLGESVAESVDLRVISATHRNLETEVSEGRFREDLLWRLNGVTLELPSLRQRPEDLPLLCRFFLESLAAQEGRPPRELSERAMEAMSHYSWPGNVRELRQVLHAASLLGEGKMLEVEDLRLSGTLGHRAMDESEETLLSLRQMEAEHVRKALEIAGGNKSAAARLLGVDRSTLYDKIRLHGI